MTDTTEQKDQFIRFIAVAKLQTEPVLIATQTVATYDKFKGDYSKLFTDLMENEPQKLVVGHRLSRAGPAPEIELCIAIESCSSEEKAIPFVFFAALDQQFFKEYALGSLFRKFSSVFFERNSAVLNQPIATLIGQASQTFGDIVTVLSTEYGSSQIAKVSRRVAEMTAKLESSSLAADQSRKELAGIVNKADELRIKAQSALLALHKQELETEDVRKLTECFDTLDIDKNNSISIEEWQQFAWKPELEDVKDHFLEFDRNQDDQISEFELFDFFVQLKRNGPHEAFQAHLDRFYTAVHEGTGQGNCVIA